MPHDLISALSENQVTPTFAHDAKAPTIFEPLRVIAADDFNSIRRKAVVPTIDINTLSFTESSDANLPRNISIYGSAPKVKAKWASESSRGDAFTAGDVLRVYVQFDQSVYVVKGGAAQDISPYVQLQTGKPDGSPGIAHYLEMATTTATDDTLVFVYTITSEDSLSDGLYVYCDCSDYFMRTFIHLNGSRIPLANGFPYQSSTILAANNNASNLLLKSDLVIDTAQTTIVGVTTNVTAGTTLAPGDVLSIYLEFSSNVTVRGLLRLKLGGGREDYCYARYAHGNDTNMLTFEYFVNDGCGTARLESDSEYGLDVPRPIIETG